MSDGKSETNSLDACPMTLNEAKIRNQKIIEVIMDVFEGFVYFLKIFLNFLNFLKLLNF